MIANDTSKISDEALAQWFATPEAAMKYVADAASREAELRVLTFTPLAQLRKDVLRRRGLVSSPEGALTRAELIAFLVSSEFPRVPEAQAVITRHVLAQPPKGPFQSAAEALDYISVHDLHARDLGKMNLHPLRLQWEAASGQDVAWFLEGKPATRDDYIAEILRLRFPRIDEARKVRAQEQHRLDDAAQVTQVAFTLSMTPDERLLEALKTAGPLARARLRSMLGTLED